MSTATERIADSLISEYGWTRTDAEEFITGWGEKSPFWWPTLRRVRKFRWAIQAIIGINGLAHGEAGPGQISLYQVHCGTWLGKGQSGKEILRDLATTALVCKIYELLMRRYKAIHPTPVEGSTFDKEVIYRNGEGQLWYARYHPTHFDQIAVRDCSVQCELIEAIRSGHITQERADGMTVSAPLPENFFFPFL